MKQNNDATNRNWMSSALLHAMLLGSLVLVILCPLPIRAADDAAATSEPATSPAQLEPTSEPANATVTQLLPPTRWRVAAVSAHGQTWSGLSENDTSPRKLIDSVAHARIPKFFTGPVVFRDEIVDEKDQQAVVQFAAILHGHAVKGEFIATAYPPAGVQCSLVLVDADGPAEELTALAGAIPVVAKLKPVDLPGGRVIGLPEGWKLNAVNPDTAAFSASGPKGESVRWGDIVQFVTPEFAKTPTGKAMVKARISEPLAPLDALKFLYKQMSESNPDSKIATIEKIVWSTTLPSSGKADSQMNEYTLAIAAPNAPVTHQRVVGTTMVFPPTPELGMWYVAGNSESAPEELFAQSYSTMSLITACYISDMMNVSKLRPPDATDHIDPMRPPPKLLIGSDRQAFAEQEAAREIVTKDADSLIQTTIARLVIRSAGDAAQTVTLHDTETGQSTEVALCTADELVKALNNAAGSNRFSSQKLSDAK